ncbi:kinetochore-associated protein DSN1 homolog isoform X2 [Lepisosteus oculatus]|uniref:kinetochore-associated protein DSN1 homolog isoform X2 n=1 Tax=Lepisosteus oculatus TaxID=7918 RepID=UPI0035F5287B
MAESVVASDLLQDGQGLPVDDGKRRGQQRDDQVQDGEVPLVQVLSDPNPEGHRLPPTEDTPRGVKRAPCRSPSPREPQSKSPRTSLSPVGLPPLEDAGVGGEDPGAREHEGATARGSQALSPFSRRKSWRKSARGRKSLPALPTESDGLCKEISKDLPENERLTKLLEASVKFALTKLQQSLLHVPGADLELLQSEVSSVCEEVSLLRSAGPSQEGPSVDTKPPDSNPPKPEASQTVEEMKRSIEILTAECSAWESLLQKHRCRAEEMARRVSEGKEHGIPLDPGLLSQSSQSKVILGKPDYRSVLQRQTPALQFMELLVDNHCKLNQMLLSFQQEAEGFLKKASAKLTSSAFRDLEQSPIKKILKVFKSSSAEPDPVPSSV